MVGPSCSLLHCPIDLDSETALDAELKGWLAFAKQKLDEVAVLTRAVNEGRERRGRRRWPPAARRVEQPPHVAAHPQPGGASSAWPASTTTMLRRSSPFAERRKAQQARLELPLLPTTTIGSFPQTAEVRKARAALKKGEWTAEQYEAFCREEIERTVRFQEEIGLDVLVHGEFERNDMVEYFGEQLDGFAFTEQRLGAELRLALREAADHLRRRVAAAADDRRAGASTPSRSPRGR